MFLSTCRSRRVASLQTSRVFSLPRPRVPPMKRTARTAGFATAKASGAKKSRAEPKTYHLTPSRRDETGGIIWPAPTDKMEAARSFIRDCVAARQPTLIVPDKDADGLTSGRILHRTLTLLGLDPGLISVYFMEKGANVHDETSRAAMAALQPAFIFVLDQGSRASAALVDGPHRALVIDHHHALKDDHPAGALFVTAYDSPPIATSSLLTFLICRPLHADVEPTCSWLCAIGTQGDLGDRFEWAPPFPDMAATFRRYTKGAVSAAIALLNAPRRTAAFDVRGAWTALAAADSPKDVCASPVLRAAKDEVSAETKRVARTPPAFSADGTMAVFRIHSTAQVHPVIATRWAGFLASPGLQAVLVANDGYLPGRVHFSCRVPRSARGRDPPVDLIEVLEGVARRAPDATLRARLGANYARGHREASGGIVGRAEFDELMDVLELGKKGRTTPAKQGRAATRAPTAQANTLEKIL